jgi:hypothetical protein
MQKIQISFIPVSEPEGEDINRFGANALGVLPAEYDLATLENGRYRYHHKLMLTNTGSVLQIITKDADNKFTVATLQNAFLLTDKAVCMEVIDFYGDHSKYILKLTETSLAAGSSQILHSARNPQLKLAEVTTIEGTGKTKELNIIGTEDIRPGLQSRVLIPPGQPTEVFANAGNILLKY